MPVRSARFGDVAHIGHIELLTPRLDASLGFFTSVVGLHETARSGDSVYLRAWGDYEHHTLKLTAHQTSGLGHLALRVRDAETLQQLVATLAEHSILGTWTEDKGHGPAYRVATPDGHAIELYWETERFKATPEVSTAFKSGVNAPRLEQRFMQSFRRGRASSRCPRPACLRSRAFCSRCAARR